VGLLVRSVRLWLEESWTIHWHCLDDVSRLCFSMEQKYYIDGMGWCYVDNRLYSWRDLWEIKDDNLDIVVPGVMMQIYRDAIVADSPWSPELHRTWCSSEFKMRVRCFLLVWNRFRKARRDVENNVRLVIIGLLAKADRSCVTGFCNFSATIMKCATRAWNQDS
jgi:hypothetical protein